MKIIAHRGDSANHPENTPTSWNAAYDAGAFAVEADIRFSTDGIGLCIHDLTLSRLFGRSERADALSFGELKQINKEHNKVIGLLIDVLDYAANGRPILLDLKDESPEGLLRLWDIIASKVPQRSRHLIFVGCHTIEAIRFFAAYQQVTILGFILDKDAGLQFIDAGATIIRLWESDVTAARIALLASAGAEIWTTTGAGTTGRPVGDADKVSLKLMANAGVTGFIVNDVLLVKSILESFE